jgi:hypothetical protein
MKCCRYRILFIAVAVILGAHVQAMSKSLTAEYHGDHLRVRAPQVRFIEGEALQKLHNGSTVAYVLSMAVAAGQNAKHTFLLEKRFLVSYDLWEEKYSVVQAGPGGRAASRLTAEMTEAWCLENMPIPVQAVPERRFFMIRLECSIEENENGNEGKSSSSLTLAGLIDIFSRKPKTESPKWEAVSELLHLDDLKKRREIR